MAQQKALKRATEAKANQVCDTRRKILIGAMMLEQMEKNEAAKAIVMGKLDAFLTRTDDRALFGFVSTPATLPPEKEKI